MSGLLDFALGFGSGAAGAFAQTKQMEIANRAEETRMKNLELLRTKYRREEIRMKAEEDIRVAQATAESEAPASPEAASTLGDLATDMGYRPGTPEHAAEVRRLHLEKTSQERIRGRSGNTTTVISSDGTISRVDNNEVGNLGPGNYVFDESLVRTDPNSKSRYYAPSPNVAFRETKTGVWRRIDPETGELIENRQEPARRERPEPVESDEQLVSPEQQDRIVNSLIEGASFIDPGLAIGPWDVLTQIVSDRPGLSNFLGDPTSDAATRADQLFNDFQKSWISAFAMNSGEGRIAGWEKDLAIENYPFGGKGARSITSERAMFNRLEQSLAEIIQQKQFAEDALEEHRRLDTLNPSQVANARQRIANLGNVITMAEGILDARILATARLGGQLIWNMSDSDLLAVPLEQQENLSNVQERAIMLRNRYR